MLNTPEFWVLIATIIFVIILGYMGVFGSLIEAIDSRRVKIQAELDEARRLKQEAQELVAHYERKRGEAESEAAAMLATARAEADRYAEEAKVRMDEFVQRRTKMAETKIAQAESQALADVRAAAADAAVAAAGDILSQSARGKVADALITRGIADVKAKLN